MANKELTVLLVEDNEPDARFIEELFTELDWQHSAAESNFSQPELVHKESLEQARQLIQGRDIEIVLLDLNLPDSRGIETVDSMLEIVDHQPVVVLTGLDDEAIGVSAVEHGAQDYLVKDEVTATLLSRTIRYAFKRHERERQLEQRNEELTLLNRLLRHDIRDDMALIRGWGEPLLDHVDTEGKHNLELMLDASEHVIELTDTVGEFLDTLQNREEVELRPFPLDSTLQSEIEKARSVYEDATFEHEEFPSVSVLSTELLSSIFRNVLANAVQHNDSADPIVTISTTIETDTVSIAIADNGPGVPAHRRDAIFGRTADGLGDPEAGVGLYLVDTLVDMYDGSITVETNDPRGSIFEVTLQRA